MRNTEGSSRSYGKVQARVRAEGCGSRFVDFCRIAGLILITATLLLNVAIPAWAAAQPNAKRMESMDVYRNLAESGDMLFVFHWDFDYDSANLTQPEEPASDTIIYRFLDTDGDTLLVTGKPFVYSPLGTNGYEDNVGYFYFSAADNLTWGQGYTVSVYGSPGFYNPAVDLSYVVQTEDYTSATTQVTNRAELYALVMSLADRFASLYDLQMKAASDSGIVLSPYGEGFFRGAIGGLMALCPALFYMQVYVPERMTVQEYDMSAVTPYTARTEATELGRGFTRLGDLMGGMSKSFAAGIVFLAVMATIIYLCLRENWGIDAGLLISIPVGIAFALIVGDIIFTVMMCLSLLAAIGIMYLLVLKRG